MVLMNCDLETGADCTEKEEEKGEQEKENDETARRKIHLTPQNLKKETMT